MNTINFIDVKHDNLCIFRVNKADNEATNGNEMLSTEAYIESNHDDHLIVDSPKRSKRIRKRKRKRATGSDGEAQEDSSKAKMNDSNAAPQSKQLLNESKKLLKKLSLTNNVGGSSTKAISHIRFVEIYCKEHNIIYLSYRFSNDDAAIDAIASSKSAPSNQLDALQPRVIRPSVVCMYKDLHKIYC